MRCVEQLKIFPFYTNFDLLKIDLAYLKTYFAQNPYRICKDYFKNEPDEIKYSYGETWVSSVPKLVHHVQVGPDDVVFDLGSGTGRVSFWLQKISGCRVVAVEIVPTFVSKSRKMKDYLKNEKVTFLEQDILKVDYSGATLIYFYGTSFSDEFITKLLKKWNSLKTGTRILTTSYHLNEYLSEPGYKLIDEYQASYPWGKCDLYLQEKL